MRIDYEYTHATNGGFGVLGKGIERALIAAGHEITTSKPDVRLVYGTPDILNRVGNRNTDKPLIFYTVWESSQYPKEWIDMYRRFNVDLILTASKFTQRSIKRAGWGGKCFVWYHGIDDRWKYKPRRDDDVFTFIHYNAYEWRKGWEIVLGAFMEEFESNEPVKLVLKARELNEGLQLRPEMDVHKPLDLPNVEELLGYLSDEDMVDLMERADCGVFPVKGEGWFLPSMECVAQGIPVILPNQMAMKEQWGVGYIDLEIEGWFNAKPRFLGAMIMPSKEDLRKKMRWAFENEQTLREIGKIGSKEVFKKFNWRKIVKDLEIYINSVI